MAHTTNTPNHSEPYWQDIVSRPWAPQRFLVCGCAVLAALTGCSAAPQAPRPPRAVGATQQALFQNGDFESGPADAAPTNWTLQSYVNPYPTGVTRQDPQTRAGLNLQAGGALETTTLYSAGGEESQPDQALGSGASLRWPKYGNYVAYLNHQSGTNRNINSLSQTMTLGVNDVDPYDGKPHIRFAVAPVLQNPNHQFNQQPYYFVQVSNESTNQVLYVDYNASGEPGIPWKVANGINYTDWQLKDIAPTSTQAALGDTIKLEVIAAGCNLGGHFGRVYVDGVGPTVPGLSVTASGPASANADSDITYDLQFANGGSGTAGNVVVEFNTPPNTTFKSVSAPGAACTQPSVGTTGLAACTFGLLDPGASGWMQVTVHIDGAATGTITAGNYQISANNASPLLGSKVHTKITSGATYTDVGVSITNGVGAVDWGQALTYTIVATNNGPAALTGGTLTDTMPSELTSVTWTCTGSGGAGCSASGSGDINDGSVDLPVGGFVTYTVSATVVASGSATRLVNTASFTLPSGLTDSQPADNAAADTDPISGTYTLTLNKAGSATGSVVSVPGAIQCDAGCNSQTASFTQNAQLVLAAIPTTGMLFTGWSGGGCSGTDKCTITLTADTTVTATFDSPPACSQDSDCDSTHYCDGDSLICALRLPNGASIPTDGVHDGTCATAGTVCVSLLCNANKCAKPVGTSCTTGAECAYNTCTGGMCTTKADGADCSSGSECQSSTCTSSHCVPSSNGCYLDGDCTGNQYCDRPTLTCSAKLDAGSSIPSDGLHSGTCSSAAAVCVSGLCNATARTCALIDGASCSATDQCVSNTCTSAHCVPASFGCYLDADCGSTQYCDRDTLTCTAKLSAGQSIPAADGYHAGTCDDAPAVCATGKCNADQLTCAAQTGASCADASECTYDVCDSNGLCGIQNGGSGCDAGNAAELCQSGTCASSGYCVPSGGSGCYVDSDCGGSDYCDRATLTCAAKLGNAAPIPNDGLHDGRCTTPNASAVCASSGCNATTGTCASNNGSACTAPEQCVRNICGSNGLCGYAYGSGPCDQSNAKFVCQSATCSPTGNVCVPPATRSCAVDADCATDEFCNASNGTCTSDLADGQSLPSDPLHSGLCSTSLAQAVCVSGQCNVSTNRCAAPLGTNCSGAADCAVNLCGSNGQCGAADGQGPCTPSNEASLCQSGVCSLGGVCTAAGSCRVDADCSQGTYCDASTQQCVAQRQSGSALPDDGYHDGTCPSSGLSAVCASGMCSTKSQRCVSPNGAACSDDAECASGTCGSNGLCGIEDSGSGCTPGADPACQSGACAADNTCSPSAVCTSDAQCAGAGGFCSDGACLPRLPIGAAIPDDTLHTGSCDAATGAAVCESGLCNSDTNTCAATLAASCATASQCVSNLCGVNGQCGLPDGSGPCTSGTAGSVCQSGACSDQTSTCVPPGGCGNDADCASSAYCDGETFTCTATLATGTPLPNDGLHDGSCTLANARVCTSAMCNLAAASCALDNGEDCAAAADCASNVCATDGKCGAQNGSGNCTVSQASACRSGACSPSALVCMPAGGCATDNDCSSAHYCDPDTYQCHNRLPSGTALPNNVNAGACPSSGVTRVCSSGLCSTTTNTCGEALGAPCAADNECQIGMCGTNMQCGVEDGGSCDGSASPSTCQSGTCDGSACSAAVSCSADTDCAPTGYCDGSSCRTKRTAGQSLPNDGLHDGKCTQQNATAACTTGMCNDTTDTCAGAFNAPCASAADCVANTCGSDAKCGLGVGDGRCNDLNAAAYCRTGLCSLVGVCLPDQPPGCALDSDCASDMYCARDTYTCMPKLGAGTPIPNDALHMGACTAQSAAAVCASSGCNETTDTCALSNGSDCSTAAECIENVCGENQKCGLAEGDGPCTTATAARCQSGRCSSDGNVCIEDTTGCARDGDCSDTTYCDPDARRCVPKLPQGTQLPRDTLHDGVCAPGLAIAVCQSEACNAATATCALANGEACQDAADCISNFCGNNGRCGLALGQTGCNANNETTVCQSGHCAASGACIPADGCNIDADCSGDKFCDRSSRSCAPKRAAGDPLPKDGLHDGTCSPALSDAVCASAACNSVTNTCASPATEACSMPEQCITNVCADNGQCGFALGGGPCTDDAQCQSGRCLSTSSECVASKSGCSADGDCDPADHCDTDAKHCVADLDDGQRLPGGASCSLELARSVCKSGACNPQTDSCAKLGGETCTDDADCAANHCVDGRCGSPDGTGECTADNALRVCQSGQCAADFGRCVAAIDGCRQDSDCRDYTYCDATTLACVQRVAAGDKLPDDALHTGTCDAALAAMVCATGACNSKTDRCAYKQGRSCAAATDCASNACLAGVCVARSEAPPAFSLSGGGCSTATVRGQTRSWPALSLWLLAAFALRRRRKQRRRAERS